MTKKLLYGWNLSKTNGKKLAVYKGVKEPPLVFGLALIKTLKSASAQPSQHWATFKLTWRC